MLGQRESAEDTSGPEETATVQNRMWLDVRKLPGGSLTTCSRHEGACGEVAHCGLERCWGLDRDTGEKDPRQR